MYRVTIDPDINGYFRVRLYLAGKQLHEICLTQNELEHMQLDFTAAVVNATMGEQP